jgi:hypothetical protein
VLGRFLQQRFGTGAIEPRAITIEDVMRGAPARAIQEIAGHTDLRTTQRYMHLSPAALDAAIRLLDSPSVRSSHGNMMATASGQ